ncbi:hypothetical protein ABKN59_004639 [Abortiporus biennis]
MATRAATPPNSRFTAEEKGQLIANLELEVEHRTKQFEEWLADALENFKLHQEGLISRVPRLVRNITMRDFAKYNGDVQECLKGLQRERLGGEVSGIDKTTRKRKWVESQEAESSKAGSSNGDTADVESTKGPKSARMMAGTPKKKLGQVPPSTTQRSRLPTTLKTPGTLRTAHFIPPSPSPRKAAAAGTNKPIPFPRVPGSRPGSPTKPTSPTKPSQTRVATTNRVPSSSTFNPAISSTSHPRWPRKDESMLSVNGSPLANPYQLGFGFAGWLSGVPEGGDTDDTDTDTGGGDKLRPMHMHKRTNSIVVRSVSSSSVASSSRPPQTLGAHSRSASQASIMASHSRSNSNHNNTNGFVPARVKDSKPPVEETNPFLLQPAPKAAALVSVPTHDGHILEFDPLHTSPAEIDALEGISESAKKQAKDDIARLVMQAVERWKLT